MTPAVQQQNPTLRESKRLTTRLALQHAALRLAAAHGVERLTVQAISEAAQVSPRTFFNYFSSKEDALVGDSPQLDERLRARLAAASDGSIVAALRVVVREVAVEAAGRRDEVLLRRRLLRDDPALLAPHLAIFAARERALAGTIAAHLALDPEHDLRPALIAAFATTALRVAFQSWDGQSETRLGELVDEAFDMLEWGYASLPSAASQS